MDHDTKPLGFGDRVQIVHNERHPLYNGMQGTVLFPHRNGAATVGILTESGVHRVLATRVVRCEAPEGTIVHD